MEHALSDSEVASFPITHKHYVNAYFQAISLIEPNLYKTYFQSSLFTQINCFSFINYEIWNQLRLNQDCLYISCYKLISYFLSILINALLSKTWSICMIMVRSTDLQCVFLNSILLSYLRASFIIHVHSSVHILIFMKDLQIHDIILNSAWASIYFLRLW